MKNILILLVIYLAISSCSTEPETHLIKLHKEINLETGLNLRKISELKENISSIGKIKCFAFMDDSTFVAVDSELAQVIIYSIQGTQLIKVGSKGRGPFEYISPSVVKSDNNRIYIWCESLLKLLVFDKSGKPIKEYNNFSEGVKYFIPYENYICFYNSGGFDGTIVEIYNLNTDKFVSQTFGKKSNEHKVLNTYACAGGLVRAKDDLFFASSDKLAIYKVDLQNFTSSLYSIKDKEFRVEQVDEDPGELIANMQKSLSYIYGNDMITGLFCTEKYIVLKAEVGKVKMNGFKFEDISKRYQKYYILDRNMRLKYAIRAKLNEGCDNCLFTSNRNNLYTLKLNIKDTNFVYELNEVDLDSY